MCESFCANQQSEVKEETVHFQACFVWDSSGVVVTGGWGCSENVSWSIQCECTIPPPLLPQPTTTVRKSLVCLVRSSGQLVPEQLHGCGVAGKEPIASKPRRGFCISSAVHPPTPTALPSYPPSSPVLRQLRPAGETAGWCCQGERWVRVCLCVRIELGGG